MLSSKEVAVLCNFREELFPSRPAFMDEYEKLEDQLKVQYNTFVQRFMSLSFLEQRLEDIEKAEQNQLSQREVRFCSYR